MRRPTALAVIPLLLAALLAGCGGDQEKKAPKEAAVDKGLPSVTGGYGTKPKIKADPKVKPGTTTKSLVLSKGDGPKVEKGDLLVADYLGQVYATNKVFDNSYDRGQPAAFQIGAGKVIAGWDKALVGVNTGSRVLMVVPPAEGYGAEGNKDAGITGTDSLVFVVDVIASYGKDAAKTSATVVDKLPDGLPKVTGELGQQPKITVPKGTPPPKKPEATILAKGSGPGLEANKLAVMHFQAVTWDGKPVASSWEGGAPQAVPIGGGGGQPTPFDILLGIPVGSRVLITLPPQEGGDPAKDSIAVVADVIAQHGPAKEKA